MKKTNLGSKYDVEPGEHIKIVMTPKEGAGESNVTAKSNGSNSQFSAGTTPRLEFDCKAGQGLTTSAVVSCSFPANIPDDAFFLIKISGKAGEDTDSLQVTKSDDHDPEFRFEGV
ncbi:MAG: hypothetical protein AABN33_06155 [Acidobacteriota bacterium]